MPTKRGEKWARKDVNQYPNRKSCYAVNATLINMKVQC